ncbi:MAG: hypothetical protein KGK00_00850 [Paracoccaceae bacterium]|nr:hypothetical protein [Paracoccaceae bacterium]MDE3237822.1 hypothetical protein [Paracoccaceae bacterium]
MSFQPDHDLHKRRLGRNLGLGLSLIAFVVIVFGITIVKVSDQPRPWAKKAQPATSVSSGASATVSGPAAGTKP